MEAMGGVKVAGFRAAQARFPPLPITDMALGSGLRPVRR